MTTLYAIVWLCLGAAVGCWLGLAYCVWLNNRK